MKKALYFHGLESNGLADEKRVPLEELIKVEVPIIKYKTDKNVIPYFTEYIEAHRSEFDFIIGSSIGGRLGFYMANKFDIPFIAFNPSVISERSDLYLPVSEELKKYPLTEKYSIIWGKNDTVINNKAVSEYLTEKYNLNTDSTTWLDIGHIIHKDVLCDTVSKFLPNLI